MAATPFTLFDYFPRGVLVVEDEQVEYVNPALASLLGVDKDALLSHRLMELVDGHVVPQDQGWVRAAWEKFRQGQDILPEEVWIRLRVPGGERVFSVQASHGPGTHTRVYVVQDAEPEGTTQRLAEALLEAAVRFVACREPSQVLETAADALFGEGLSCVFFRLEEGQLVSTVVREDAQLLEGLAQRGLDLKALRIPLVTSPEAQARFQTRRAKRYQEFKELFAAVVFQDAVREFAQSFGLMQGLEAPLFVEDRPFGMLVVRARVLRPAVAAVLEMFARQVGAALANTEHHRRADKQVEALRKLQKELVHQERLAALGEAAAVVSHEVRNPLGAILNGMAVLRRQHPGQAPEVLQMMEEEALRIEQLVKDLLDLARPLTPRWRPVELETLARTVAEQFAIRHPQGRVEVRLDGGPLPKLQADATLLQLALENLLRNALQASPHGGRIRVRVGASEGGVCLAVEDEGPGIPEDDVERIFEPFFTRKASGTGLGLALVRRVVEAHGGRVQAGRAALGGACFEVTLPHRAGTD